MVETSRLRRTNNERSHALALVSRDLGTLSKVRIGTRRVAADEARAQGLSRERRGSNSRVFSARDSRNLRERARAEEKKTPKGSQRDVAVLQVVPKVDCGAAYTLSDSRSVPDSFSD